MDNSKVFELGKYRFKLRNYSQADAADVEALFPIAGQGSSEHPTETLDLLTQERGGVRAIINTALQHHQDCIWIAAATLISPNGKCFLFAGPSCSGKSSLATALAFGKDWRIVAEDVSLIDTNLNQFVSFVSPISMKAGALQLVASVIGEVHCPPLFNEWIPLKTKAVIAYPSAKIDFAFILEVLDNGGAQEVLTTSQISPELLLIKLLPLSNLLHLNNATEQFSNYLKAARCFKLCGGHLNERLDFVIELSGLAR